VCSDKKIGGDSWSKIYFKHLLRTTPITIEDIAAALHVTTAMMSSASSSATSSSVRLEFGGSVEHVDASDNMAT
jgi:hypothetical protein